MNSGLNISAIASGPPTTETEERVIHFRDGQVVSHDVMEQEWMNRELEQKNVEAETTTSTKTQMVLNLAESCGRVLADLLGITDPRYAGIVNESANVEED
ncbi:hypothetical protein EG68_03518 [Paragonimus skrjabini miyazakii]|uniref:Uncharacterized protein n=1 Tax=Paragonimus skrjabini miyazakii TaxID=59628 RepID=A0A8S9Z3M3_9TREM|nr:hypothetical protein EG68_03518 [Paragonimus skrjabini miyazakii]